MEINLNWIITFSLLLCFAIFAFVIMYKDEQNKYKRKIKLIRNKIDEMLEAEKDLGPDQSVVDTLHILKRISDE